QLPDRRNAQPGAVQPGPLPPASPVELRRRRRVNDAERDLAVLLQREERRPVRNPPDEVLRAVDRIDDPASRLLALRPVLLAEKPDVGERGAEPFHDGGLRLLVGLGDRRVIGLLHHPHVAPEVAEGNRAGGASRVERGLQDAVGHDRGSPRTRSPMMLRWTSDVPPAIANRRANTVWKAQRPPSGARGVARHNCPETPRRPLAVSAILT